MNKKREDLTSTIRLVLIQGHSRDFPHAKKSQSQNKAVVHSRLLKTLFNVLVNSSNCCPVSHMGLLGTVLDGLVLACVGGLGGLEEGGIQGAVDARLGSNTRGDKTLSVLPNQLLRNVFIRLACGEDMAFASRVNRGLTDVGLGYPSQ